MIESVKEYYGKILQSKNDLKTSACCLADSLPVYQQKILSLINDEIKNKFYGCGSPIPLSLEGKTVLDLGCGTGRDAFMLSYLVGPTGRVIGIDMTDEQLHVARRNVSSQMEKFGFASPNVEFVKGFIEDLSSIPSGSVDVVVSNCVINLSPDKKRVFAEIFRVLKEGGELYFSDVFTSSRVPMHLREDPVLYGECLSGALYVEDFRRILLDIGYPDYRVLKKSKIELHDLEIIKKAGMIDFYSITIRVFKLSSMEDICEDYGQVATYLGGISESEHRFVLYDHHTFVKGKPMLVCGNSCAMVQDTRFAKYFEINGDRSTHFGPFDCGPDISSTNDGGGCC